MGNLNCCRTHSSFAELNDLKSEDPIHSPLQDIQKEDTKSYSRYRQESANIDLSEWSTTERLARIQEAGGSNLVISIKNGKKSEVIKITPKGLDPPVREIRDGVVYFGCKRKNEAGEIVVDYKSSLSKSKKSIRGPHFMIYYDLDSLKYYLHDLMIGFGTFVKISHTHQLENENLLNFGDCFLLVNIIPRYENDNYPKLKLKLVTGRNEHQIFYFNAQEFYLSSIVVGRSRKCHVFIDDGMVSKVHASLVFTADQKWVIIDGTNNRNSLNGTWLYVNKDCALTRGMEFKACDALFKVIK